MFAIVLSYGDAPFAQLCPARLIFFLDGSFMLLLNMILWKMLRERYASLSHFLHICFICESFSYFILLRVVQIVELNDERNWRSGLRVRLLSTCMVIISFILSTADDIIWCWIDVQLHAAIVSQDDILQMEHMYFSSMYLMLHTAVL